MKITLRKKDSVVSIVLFIFNIVGELKNEYTINLQKILEYLQYFGKSEASIRTGLSRMVNSGILTRERKNNETVYGLSEEGLNNINLWNKSISRFFNRYNNRFEDWDKKWKLLEIIDFNKSEFKNQFVLDEFKETGLREINNNWITPYSLDDDVILMLKDRSFKHLIFSVTVEEGMDIDTILKDFFQLDALKIQYSEFISKIKKKNELKKEKKGGELLPILFEIGWDFYDIVTEDPALPVDLLGEWEGDKAVENMKNFRTELLKEISIFLKADI